MGSKNSTGRQGTQNGRNDHDSHSAGGVGSSRAPGNPIPQHLANQYSNNSRQRPSATSNNTNNASSSAVNAASATATTTSASQPQPQPPSSGGSTANNGTTTSGSANERNTTRTQPEQSNRGNELGVQEGQMVKMLATIEASTVSYSCSTNILTFYITCACSSLTYEIHTGVKMFVQAGTVFYMPNKPKMEPSRTLVEGAQDGRKVTVRLDVSNLDEKERVYNRHYQKQMPCVVVLRYRTSELRKTDYSEAEEVVVEHTEHTAVDLAEKSKRRVISQIVTAGDNAYVVENLYGADNETLGGGDAVHEVMVGSTIVPHEGEEDEDGLCVICITNPKDTAVMPCRHMCMCKNCSEELLKHKPVCPVCRAPISTLLHMPTVNNTNT